MPTKWDPVYSKLYYLKKSAEWHQMRFERHKKNRAIRRLKLIEAGLLTPRAPGVKVGNLDEVAMKWLVDQGFREEGELDCKLPPEWKLPLDMKKGR